MNACAAFEKEDSQRSREEATLREKLYKKHVEMHEAIRAQEQQMQLLSDIIPALDMVHSSLISRLVDLDKRNHSSLVAY